MAMKSSYCHTNDHTLCKNTACECTCHGTAGAVITHREVRLGDTVALDFATPGWDRAKVIQMTPTTFTLMRPWMNSNDQYPMIGVEIFTCFRDSAKTVILLTRMEANDGIGPQQAATGND